MITITNGRNTFNVYPDESKSGKIILVGVIGNEQGKARTISPHIYEELVKTCGYSQVQESGVQTPMFI